MKKFFETVEEKWLASRTIVDTPTGPQNLPITQYSVWTHLYPPAEIKRLSALFDLAEKKVQKDAMSLKRVKFFRERFLDVMAKHCKEYHAMSNNAAEVRLVVAKRSGEQDLTKPIRIPGNTAYLRRLKNQKTNIALQAVASKESSCPK